MNTIPALSDGNMQDRALTIVPFRREEHTHWVTVGDAPFSTGYRVLSPGEFPHEEHTHPEHEAFIVVEGAMEMLINGGGTVISAGEVGFVQPNVPHTIRNHTDSDTTVYMVKTNG